MGPTCSVTGYPGKKISETTLSHLLREEALLRAQGREWFFCADPTCDVVYFTADGATLSKDDLRVRVGLKESTPPRTLCYCFGHNLEDVERTVAAGRPTLLADEITEKCRQGLDRCEETNPQGSCCLGNVRRATRAAQARLQPAPPGSGVDDHDCCNASQDKETP